MKNNFKYTFFIFLTVLFISCKQNFKTQVTINTDKVNSLKVGISGSWGTAKIDWGNGSTINSNDLWSLPIYFKNNYSDKKAHTITINGSKLNTISGLFCFDNQITSLNVSNITKLKTLDVLKNRLQDIDVRNNPELSELNCTWNQLKYLDISKNTLLETRICLHERKGTLK